MQPWQRQVAEPALNWVEERRKGGPDLSIEETGIHLRRAVWYVLVDVTRDSTAQLIVVCDAARAFPSVHQFSLLAGLFNYLFSKTEVHLLILGLDHAGKTVSTILL